MVDILAIASTLIVVAIGLYLRFGVRKYLKQVVHNEFRAVCKEAGRLKEEYKQDDLSDSK